MKRNDQDAPGSARPSGTAGTGPAGVMHNSAGVMHNPPRARTRVVGQPCSPTEILKESLCSPTTGARVCVREGGKARIRDTAAYFRAWREAKFGGDIDPVRVAVDEAVAAFSTRDPARDRGAWLSVANEIGYEAFLELYHEQKSILDDCRRRGNPLRHPAAAFQARLNRYTGHGKRKGGSRELPEFINSESASGAKNPPSPKASAFATATADKTARQGGAA